MMEAETAKTIVKDAADKTEADAMAAVNHPDIVGLMEIAPTLDLNAKTKQMATLIVPPTLTCKVAAQPNAIGSDNGGQ
jgi:hypothetical protein